ncbi:hypothetical protein C5F47_03615 [Nitrosopumilus cobalaminigenes]|uniref:Uncharacterized protein n=1 Tax=Nitrosopumilus cobalaminigenes TaxID=1470066 RepID=A0A7D5M1X4_9ARCH|nr:hypothetical protein [Nitrosopumilus cobalaminigenes]QLH02707.1 hypothetical protein C5F47_03615 [Nitrosopumilus cobalaminigenes]
MPHIVIDKKINLFDFASSFAPIFQKSPLIKISTIYVEKNALTALLPVVVIDENHQEFFIQISTTLKKSTIRLLPLTDPIKTDTVKSTLALVYYQIKKWDKDITVTKTNLSEYLKAVVEI